MWQKQEFFDTVIAKEALSGAMFVLFLIYTAFVLLRHKNKEESLGLKFNRLVNELAYSHLFFFVGCILAHVLTPKEWPVLLIYMYIFVTLLE